MADEEVLVPFIVNFSRREELCSRVGATDECTFQCFRGGRRTGQGFSSWRWCVNMRGKLGGTVFRPFFFTQG